MTCEGADCWNRGTFRVLFSAGSNAAATEHRFCGRHFDPASWGAEVRGGFAGALIGAGNLDPGPAHVELGPDTRLWPAVISSEERAWLERGVREQERRRRLWRFRERWLTHDVSLGRWTFGVSLAEIPVPRLARYWQDEHEVVLNLSLGTSGGEPVAYLGRQFSVRRWPAWLRRRL